MSLNFNINSRDLYKYSIFFRNYIKNVAEDVLKNGILLQSISKSKFNDELDVLKIELKAALLQCIISYRFNGAGYILVKTNDEFSHLSESVNLELPIGFMYLDYSRVYDAGPGSNCITYYARGEDAFDNLELSSLEIHKSRLLIYENYDYVLGSHSPCYSASFLLNVYLLEKIYSEIEKRIENNNFLFYKDESLSHIKDALSTDSVTLELAKKRSSDKNSFFKDFFTGFISKEDGDVSSLSRANDELMRELERLKSKLDNDGIFYSCEPNASLEVIKYDLSYLKEALSLVKAKIGADTKEPLTRSFNEQVKGLGSDGKGDRSNYYDFLKGTQDQIEVAVNNKLVKYFGLKMHFGSLVMLSEPEKIERDMRLLEIYERYSSVISNPNLSLDEKMKLKENLFTKLGD
ncbi:MULTISPECIES: anti-CBASS protein Acb1 family protein [Borrelia]|uniref:Phage portal protein n=4 Tax=Borrelia TaxID=138 RepID=Q9KKC1_BORHE|nr:MULTISPECIES: anti-CBASS Acb1 family protein [Borrelia]AAF28886.1 unknown [Borrelia hermsii]AMR76215.1 phage portal protein [Borrelia hermsii]ANA44041.1 phage portal protein [Borrelia hermsii HS1]UPA08270.1 DUF1073 domain-containing protein [Borrelia hermsii DAH]UPA09582.1 DUF1073 domain-containing protein [Borrelia nietonii YOR]